MKNDLVITDRKVVNLTAFRETIGLKVVPLFFPCIFFVKIDVKKDGSLPVSSIMPVWSSLTDVTSKYSSMPLGRR